MIRKRQVVLFRFPQTNQATGKLRPALVIRNLPGPHNDWLICMISSQLSQEVQDFDEIISEKDDDFILSGLKQTSLIRIGRLAVVDQKILVGAIGQPEAGARCVNSARRDLCGGCRATGIPTATSCVLLTKRTLCRTV